MGAGRGGNFGNSDDGVSRFADNLADIIEEYVLSPLGYFGEKTKNNNIRHIISDNPLETMKDFVNRAIPGASIKPLPNGKGWHAKFSDGFEIIYREISSSDGTPALEIWTRIKSRNASSTVEVSIDKGIFKLRYQKIHFVPAEK